MATQVHNGTGLVGFAGYVHNGTSLVAVNDYVHNGTSLVSMSAPPVVDGPVPVVASSTTAAQTVSSGTTVNVILPTGLATDDYLVAAAVTRTSGATQSIPGWTAHTAAVVTGAQSHQFLSRRVTDSTDAAALSGATVVLTSSAAARQAIRVLRITGGRVIDVVGTGSGSSTGTTRPIGPVTTTGSNRLLIGMWGTADSTITITKDAAMTEVGSQINSGGVVATHAALVVATETIAAAGATGTRTATLSATTISGGQLLAVAPAYL